jgi:hypothetical protein
MLHLPSAAVGCFHPSFEIIVTNGKSRVIEQWVGQIWDKSQLAQACTATSSDYFVIAQFKTLVCSGSKAEMDFGEVSLTRREQSLSSENILGRRMYTIFHAHVPIHHNRNQQ